MPVATRLIWMVPLALVSTAAPGQTSRIGSGAETTASSGASGFGTPVVPNNSLPPLPGSTAPSLSPVTPSLSPVSPSLSPVTPVTPNLSPATPGFDASTTPGVTIQLSPPRTCPSGITFC